MPTPISGPPVPAADVDDEGDLPVIVETEPPAATRPTRRRLAFWDRTKVLVLLALIWGLLLWSSMSNDPLLGFRDAVDQAWRAKWWLEGLFGLELLRQVHYFTSEHWAGYHRMWSVGVFGGFERRSLRIRDWTRYRISRALKVIVFLSLLAVAAGAILHESPVSAFFELPSRFFHGLPFIFQLLAGVVFVILEFGALFWFLSRGGTDVYFPDDIKTRFSDVWGQDAVLARVKESMVFLEDPESIESRGGYVPGGILLWGPPGTGKTLMAEAVAGETGKPFVFVDPGAFINMFFGVGILKVKSLFRKLRKLSVRYGGVIVFFDEADSLGNRGLMSPGGIFGGGGLSRSEGAPFGASGCHGGSYLSAESVSRLLAASTPSDSPGVVRDRMMPMAGMGGGGMGTLQALLTELSGLKKPRGFMNRVVRRALGMQPKAPPKYRIMVMMATNMPQALDEALLRPGRIDRIYKVGYPSKAGRVRTYEGYFDKVSHGLTAAEMEKLATITPYATGATMKDLVNEALIMAIRAGHDEITWEDVIKAKQLKDLGPPEDVEYIERERHAVAIHEACHALVAYRSRHHLEIDIATIEKGGTYLGMVASIKPEDQFTSWRSEYEADVMVSLASLAGERQFFGGDSSSGVSGDLESATTLATLMEGYWGMGSTITSHGVTQKVGIGGGGRPGAGGKDDDEKKLLAGELGNRIEAKLAELLTRTEALLADNRREVLAVAHALETHKTLTGDDVEAVIEGRRGPLVDGMVYALPPFLEAAERYHARVVAAHNSHTRVDIEMPAVESWATPELAAAGNGYGYAPPPSTAYPAGPPVAAGAAYPVGPPPDAATDKPPAPARRATKRGSARRGSGPAGSGPAAPEPTGEDPPAP